MEPCMHVQCECHGFVLLQVRHRIDQELYALRMSKPQGAATVATSWLPRGHDDLHAFLREQHTHITQLLGSFKAKISQSLVDQLSDEERTASAPFSKRQKLHVYKTHAFTVYPWCDQSLAARCRGRVVTCCFVHDVVSQLCQAGLQMEAKRIVHLDMKTDNILVGDDEKEPLRILVGDFDNARILTASGTVEGEQYGAAAFGNSLHAAPEVREAVERHSSTIPYTRQSSFSLGVVGWTVATGEHPIEDYEGEHVYDDAALKDLETVEFPLGSHPDLKHLLIQLLSHDPAARPSLKQAEKMLLACQCQHDKQGGDLEVGQLGDLSPLAPQSLRLATESEVETALLEILRPASIKAITARRPWSSLILAGVKVAESRERWPSTVPDGWFALHSGTTFSYILVFAVSLTLVL
jgi:serine/threonine protein kinase